MESRSTVTQRTARDREVKGEVHAMKHGKGQDHASLLPPPTEPSSYGKPAPAAEEPGIPIQEHVGEVLENRIEVDPEDAAVVRLLGRLPPNRHMVHGRRTSRASTALPGSLAVSLVQNRLKCPVVHVQRETLPHQPRKHTP